MGCRFSPFVSLNVSCDSLPSFRKISCWPYGTSLVCYLLLLPCCVFSRFSRVRLFATPWTVAHQAPLSLGFSRPEYWSGLPCPPPGDRPHPGIKLTSLLRLLHWQVGSLIYHHQGSFSLASFNILSLFFVILITVSLGMFLFGFILYDSGPQPFWKQGLVVGKTVFLRIRMVGGGHVSDGEQLQPGSWGPLLFGTMCISWAGVTISFLRLGKFSVIMA